jgi:hypothetical protein
MDEDEALGNDTESDCANYAHSQESSRPLPIILECIPNGEVCSIAQPSRDGVELLSVGRGGVTLLCDNRGHQAQRAPCSSI